MHERITIVDTLADRIKKTRLELGLTQGQLADRVGVSQSTIGNIESGVRKRPRELLLIAKALDVTPDWLESGQRPDSGKAAAGRPALSLVTGSQASTVRTIVEALAELARPQRPTLRKNLANLLVELVEHPEDGALVEQTVTDIERFFESR